ncbi:MAG: rhodanese-like domain-containing protein, partial [Myxococcota bacterium]
DYDQFCGVPRPTTLDAPVEVAWARVDVATFKRRWDEGWRPFVLDVRQPHEAAIVSLPMVDQLQPHDDLAAIVDTLPRDRDIVVACKSGVRSAKAAKWLTERGFKRVTDLEGGVVAWAEQIDPSLPRY